MLGVASCVLCCRHCPVMGKVPSIIFKVEVPKSVS